MAERKAWAFVLDGHIFYVLGDFDSRTLVYDLTAEQWYLWRTAGRDFWNMHHGIMWNGLILAADDALPKIWLLDPEVEDDEGGTPIERFVSGFQPLRGRGSVLVGSLRVSASVGSPSTEGAVVKVRFSDDEGVTWSNYFQTVLNTDDFAQVLRFRSLGRVRAPGRLWEISDAGGLVRIDGADADLQ